MPLKNDLFPMRALFTAWLCWALIGAPAGARADSADLRAMQIKAVFILNIARFVEWPESAFPSEQTDIKLCMLEEDPLGGALEMIRQRKVGDRPLEIWTIDDLEQREFCQILFLSREQLDAMIAEDVPLGYPHQLTIADLTDSEDTEPLNGRALISLIRRDARIGIEINVDVAEKAELRLSSELLKLGKIHGAKAP